MMSIALLLVYFAGMVPVATWHSMTENNPRLELELCLACILWPLLAVLWISALPALLGIFIGKKIGERK